MTPSKSRRLENRVALITGIGSGMGRVAATRFASEGALVVGCDLHAQASATTVDEVRATGASIECMAPVDLGDPEQARRWVSEAAAIHGRIDILYNNASAARFGAIGEMTDEDWFFTIRNELDLVAHVTRAAWPHLCKQGGVIINIASAAAHSGEPTGLAHSATKGAVLAMTKVMATEGAAHGIRAVSISPGAIETPGASAQLNIPEVKQAILSRTRVPRFGQPEEIVAMAAFLASDEAGYITGRDYLVDGGMIP